MVCPLKAQVRKFHKYDGNDSSAMAEACELYPMPGWGVWRSVPQSVSAAASLDARRWRKGT